MSEVSKRDEPFDNDFIFLQDESCVEQEPRPRHLDEVFEEARLWQAENKESLFGTPKDAKTAMERVVKHFDEKVSEKGLLYKSAVMKGSGIEMPWVSYNDITGQFIMVPKPIDQEGGVLAMDAAVNGVAGEFVGFGYKLIPHSPFQDKNGTVAEEDALASTSYSGALVYQVTAGVGAFSNIYTQFFTTGNVLDTTLEFTDDLKKQKLDNVFKGLLDIDSLETAEQINELNVLLADKDMRTSELPAIVDLVSKIVGSKDFSDDHVRRDLLVDLLTHYIDPRESYTFSASDTIQVITRGGRTRRSFNKKPQTWSEQSISGIILNNSYRRDEDDKIIMSRGRQVPYIVLAQSDKVVHVAMDRLTKFQIES